MVTSEIREFFHARFVQIIRFWTKLKRNYFLFREYATWLPINIMGDKLSLQSWGFDTFTQVYRIDRELYALESLELKFELKFIIF